MAVKKSSRTSATRAVAKNDGAEKGFQFSKIKEFAGEVKAEFKKIVWPDKKVTIGSTGVVIMLVFVLALYLGAVDLFIGKLVSYILN